VEALRQGIGNASKDVMDRELALQRDVLMEMGDWSRI